MNKLGTIEITANFFFKERKTVRCFPNVFKKQTFDTQTKQKLTIGLSFDQLANACMLDAHPEFEGDMNKFSAYKKANEYQFIWEFCFHAHKSYCLHNNIVRILEQNQFITGLASWMEESKDNAKNLMECINKAFSYGVKKK